MDVLVIGCGPAGLACALACKHLRVTVVDAGPSLAERARDGRIDGTIVGFGGASLCNDGKFSFGTAGSRLAYLSAAERARGQEALLDLFEGGGNVAGGASALGRVGVASVCIPA
jgi:glycine/D-amino acid oxidase-like deaminating enzyme